MDLFTLAAAKSLTGKKDIVIDFSGGDDTVDLGTGLEPMDFINAIILLPDGDFAQVVATATNLNTITFRTKVDTNDFYYFYRFDDGLVHKHTG